MVLFLKQLLKKLEILFLIIKAENNKLSKKDKDKLLVDLEKEMKEAAKNLDFERAMELRDVIFELKSEE